MHFVEKPRLNRTEISIIAQSNGIMYEYYIDNRVWVCWQKIVSVVDSINSKKENVWKKKAMQNKTMPSMFMTIFSWCFLNFAHDWFSHLSCCCICQLIVVTERRDKNLKTEAKPTENLVLLIEIKINHTHDPWIMATLLKFQCEQLSKLMGICFTIYNFTMCSKW